MNIRVLNIRLIYCPNYCTKSKEKQAHYEKLGIFINTLEKHGEPITEFDAGMWGSMVEYITVDKDKKMTVTFKDGSEVQA